MNVFLGDVITLINFSRDDDNPTYVTGQVAGVILDRDKKVERVYIHDIDHAFYMSQGWKFLDEEESEEDE